MNSNKVSPVGNKVTVVIVSLPLLYNWNVPPDDNRLIVNVSVTVDGILITRKNVPVGGVVGKVKRGNEENQKSKKN